LFEYSKNIVSYSVGRTFNSLEIELRKDLVLNLKEWMKRETEDFK
jgi:hypothetical protein